MDMKTIMVSVVSSTATALLVAPLAATFVELKTTSPGTAQTGHSNITGNALAGRFGAGASPALAKVQVKDTGGLQGVRSETNTGTAVFGKSTATSGSGVAGYFTSSGTAGRAVVGDALAGTGSNVGGAFFSRSNLGGTGVAGRHTGSAGGGVGVLGETSSSDGTAGAFNNLATDTSVRLATDNYGILSKGDIMRNYGAQSFSCVPVAYGWILADGTVQAGTGNFTASKTATGNYSITMTGVSYNILNGDITNATALYPFDYLVTTDSKDGNMLVRTRSLAGAAVDGQFSFVVYSLTDAPNRPAPPAMGGLTASEWVVKRPAEAAKYRARLADWQRGQTKGP